jgi:hypothetical protein
MIGEGLNPRSTTYARDARMQQPHTCTVLEKHVLSSRLSIITAPCDLEKWEAANPVHSVLPKMEVPSKRQTVATAVETPWQVDLVIIATSNLVTFSHAYNSTIAIRLST